MHIRAAALLLAVLAGGGCRPEKAPKERAAIPRVIPVIVRSIAHDTLAFTQGLVFAGGYLFESTGQYDRSSLRRIDPSNGSVLKHVSLDGGLFGEGLALDGEHLVQLTWKSGRAIVYSRSDLSSAGEYAYSGEGWGLSATPDLFVMSNGTDTLYLRDRNFAVVRTTAVTMQGKPLRHLNELEYARGMLYANVWYSNWVFEIDLATGEVTRIVDCSELVASAEPLGDDAVLNGIAYNAQTATFYLTGKNWPLMFEVTIPLPSLPSGS